MGNMLLGLCSLIINNGLILRSHRNPQIILVSHACQIIPEQPAFISSAKAIVSLCYVWWKTLPLRGLSFTLLFSKIAPIHFVGDRWINLQGIIWDYVNPTASLLSGIIQLVKQNLESFKNGTFSSVIGLFVIVLLGSRDCCFISAVKSSQYFQIKPKLIFTSTLVIYIQKLSLSVVENEDWPLQTHWSAHGSHCF